jgi:hypothetical protein
MNRFARVQMTLSLLGLAGWLGLSVAALRGDALREHLALHLLGALAATLLIVLAQAWIAIYLLASERRLAPLLAGHGELEARLASLAPRRRLALAAGALALLLAAFAFVLAGRLFSGGISARAHLATIAAATSILAIALVLERRALVANQDLVRRANATLTPSAG